MNLRTISGSEMYDRKDDTSLYALMRMRLVDVIDANTRAVITYRNYDRIGGWNYPGIRRIHIDDVIDKEKASLFISSGFISGL